MFGMFERITWLTLFAFDLPARSLRGRLLANRICFVLPCLF